jgi:hypothetical protein
MSAKNDERLSNVGWEPLVDVRKSKTNVQARAFL